ncbi:MAG: hypothetical protein J6W27_03990 [Alphaproteobacteria bacterium]|nr:hypothetical protein [Alphaproteobacteria bacterium]
MAEKINTFDKLGRFLIDQTYNILLDSDSNTFEYAELKRIIQKRIDRNPNVDKKFAMHKYDHGNSTWHVATYRWENVLYYYINQHQNVFFLQRIYNPIPNANIHRINLMNSLFCLKNWHEDLDMGYMFEAGRQTSKKREEDLLKEIKTNPEAIEYLKYMSILNKVNQERQRFEKYRQ